MCPVKVRTGGLPAEDAAPAAPRLDSGIGAVLPSVSVVMPVRNEADHVERAVRLALAQDYPSDRWELIVADGMSTDGTREILERLRCEDSRVRWIENPRRIVSAGLNAAVAAARGDVIVRLDGHCEYSPDYVRRVVELRESTGADSAGGVLDPIGESGIQRAIVAAYRSSLVGMGGAARTGQAPTGAVREVDTVFLGCWRRDRLIAAGLFDEEMVRNQDDELSFRLRESSGRIVQSDAIRVGYVVRGSFRNLFKQFLQYGYWKVRVIRRHPRQASPRHFAPAALVGGLLFAVLLSPVSGFWVYVAGALALGYLGSMAIAGLAVAPDARTWPATVLALMTMHAGYGAGFLAGLARWFLGWRGLDGFFERITR